MRMHLLRTLAVAALATQSIAISIGAERMTIERDSDTLQDIVSSCELTEQTLPSLHGSHRFWCLAMLIRQIGIV